MARKFEKTPTPFKIYGTPNYICPEMINNEKYSFSSDIWLKRQAYLIKKKLADKNIKLSRRKY